MGKKKKVYSECLLRLLVLRVLCCSNCLFLYGPICHGALKLDISLNISSIYIINIHHLRGLRTALYKNKLISIC